MDKEQYARAFNEAREWAIANPTETPSTAARIFHVKENSLAKALRRLKAKQRNSNGVYYARGGNNRILNPTQEEAIRQYCVEQYELGLGATFPMVRAAICTLLAVSLLY